MPAGRSGSPRCTARSGLGAELRLHRTDTDQLGTFSGEVERPGDAITTCRAKAELGLEATGQTLGLASEGSFGPHPAIPFLAVGQEVLVLIDRERRLTVVEQRLEPRTTFASRSLRLTELDSEPMQRWLALVRFPSHGLIVRPEPGSAAGPSQGQCMPQRVFRGPVSRESTSPASSSRPCAAVQAGEVMGWCAWRATCVPIATPPAWPAFVGLDFSWYAACDSPARPVGRPNGVRMRAWRGCPAAVAAPPPP